MFCVFSLKIFACEETLGVDLVYVLGVEAQVGTYKFLVFKGIRSFAQ
jgi:hypothetical protein